MGEDATRTCIRHGIQNGGPAAVAIRETPELRRKMREMRETRGLQLHEMAFLAGCSEELVYMLEEDPASITHPNIAARLLAECGIRDRKALKALTHPCRWGHLPQIPERKKTKLTKYRDMIFEAKAEGFVKDGEPEKPKKQKPEPEKPTERRQRERRRPDGTMIRGRRTMEPEWWKFVDTDGVEKHLRVIGNGCSVMIDSDVIMKAIGGSGMLQKDINNRMGMCSSWMTMTLQKGRIVREDAIALAKLLGITVESFVETIGGR